MTLSNPAKLLKGYMEATGTFDTKALADHFDIPVRTIQRLKLEIACANDAISGAANSAINGVSTQSNAISGASGAANSAISGASEKKGFPPNPLPKETTPTTTVEPSTVAREAAALPDLEMLSKRLFAVAGPALANQAIAPGLASMSVPMMWLEQGADLERDVIPALQAAAARCAGKRIKSWMYFTDMVAEAKAVREAGLPSVVIPLRKPSAARDPFAITVSPDTPRKAKPRLDDEIAHA